MEGEQPYLRDLLTMVINHLLTGMMFQVGVVDFPGWTFLRTTTLKGSDSDSATLGVLLCMCDKPQAASRATHNLQMDEDGGRASGGKNAK